MDKALELWKRLFEYTSNPYEKVDGEEWCFFCTATKGYSHEPGCIWIEAKKLVEENK